MDFRKLESLQQAIPLVLRHLDAYVELAEHDFALAKNAATSRFRMTLLFAVSGMFALLLLCMVVIALTWDGPYRVLSIGIMAGLFVIVSATAASVAFRERERPFASLRREWHEDREWLRGMWSSNDSDPPSREMHSTAHDDRAQAEREAVWLRR